MNINKIWIAGAVFVMVIVVAVGWVVGVSPMLSQASAAKAERASVDAQNLAQAAELQELKGKLERIDVLKEELASKEVSVPPADNLSTFIGQLHQLESSSGVKLTDISTSEGAPFVPAPPVLATGDVAAAGEATAETPPPAELAPTGESPANAPTLSSDEFIVISVDLTVQGDHDQVMDFIGGLQAGERLYLVTGLSVVENGDDTGFTGTISGLVYVLLDPVAEAAKVQSEAEGEG
jgi:hypothetical protein